MLIYKTIAIPVDIEEVIHDGKLTKESTEKEIASAIEDYVSGLDDCFYYYIDEEDEKIIQEKVKKYLDSH